MVIYDVPYFSQLNQSLVNGCGQASMCSLIHALTEHRPGSAKQVALDTGTADGTFTTAGELITIGKHYGLTLNFTYGANLDWYRARLDERIIPIALVNYGVLFPPAAFNGSHWCCVIGFDELYIYILDPLRLNSPIPVSIPQFLTAITSLTQLGNPNTFAMYPTEALPVALKGLGLNIMGDYIDDYPLLKNRLQAAQPPAILVMDNLPRALELKALLPGTTVIYRHFRPTSDYTATTPEQWVAMHEYAGGKGLWLQADNEAPLTEAFCAWSLAVAKLCVARKWQVCLLNLGVGHPEIADWSRADALLRYIAANPTYCMVGLHEYGATLLSYPMSTESDPAKFPDIQPTEQLWFIGRFRFLLDYCKSKGIKAPKIVINEFGWDTITAVQAWQSTTPGYQEEMGYQHSRIAWQTWQPGMSAAQHAFNQLKWAWNEIYKPHPEIIGVCFYCYGGIGSWNDIYSIHRENELFDLIRTQGDFSLSTTTNPPPADPPGLQVYLTGASVVNARALPTTSSAKVGEVRTGQAVNSILSIRYIAPYVWFQVNGAIGGVTRDYWFAGIGDSWKSDIR